MLVYREGRSVTAGEDGAVPGDLCGPSLAWVDPGNGRRRVDVISTDDAVGIAIGASHTVLPAVRALTLARLLIACAEGVLRAGGQDQGEGRAEGRDFPEDRA